MNIPPVPDDVIAFGAGYHTVNLARDFAGARRVVVHIAGGAGGTAADGTPGERGEHRRVEFRGRHIPREIEFELGRGGRGAAGARDGEDGSCLIEIWY